MHLSEVLFRKKSDFLVENLEMCSGNSGGRIITMQSHFLTVGFQMRGTKRSAVLPFPVLVSREFFHQRKLRLDTQFLRSATATLKQVFFLLLPAHDPVLALSAAFRGSITVPQKLHTI